MRLKGNVSGLAYQTELSAGCDIRSTGDFLIPPGEWYEIPTGLFVESAMKYEYLKIVPRFGLARDYGVTILNAPGTVDADYPPDWEIKVLLINHSGEYFAVESGMRIAQGILCEYDMMTNVAVKKVTRRGGGSSTGVN